MKGLIFSIEEFAVFDGDGIRINVFFKGCPLRCKWCHNPEGWCSDIQIVKNPNGCIHCGICKKVCPSPQKCTLCGQCIINCPRGLIRKSGEWIDSDALAAHLLKFSPILKKSGGGLTFSGGEVLSQPDFLLELLDKTASMHRIVETSGFGNTKKWQRVLKAVDFVYYDLKIMNSELHTQYTGMPNSLILDNARILADSGVPFVIRVPFIHGINTDEKNLRLMCEFIGNAKSMQGVELLSYNKLAGAKYKLVGMEYPYTFQPPTDSDFMTADKVFSEYGIKYIQM